MFSKIITPIVTPFNRDQQQTINFEALEKLITNLLEHGVNGIFVLGSNGEFQTLSLNEKKAIIDCVVSKVNFTVPVMAGVGGCNFNEILELALYAKNKNITALSLVPPYFIQPSDQEIFDYFNIIAKVVNLPIIIYNIPKNTGYYFSLELLEKLFSINNVVGIKDSSGDENWIIDYLTITKKYNKLFLIGSDSQISFAYKHGAVGAIAGTSNLITKHVVNLWSLLEKNSLEAEKYQSDINVLRKCLRLNTVPSILKRSIELANICSAGPARLPVTDIKNVYDFEIEEMLRFYNLKG